MVSHTPGSPDVLAQVAYIHNRSVHYIIINEYLLSFTRSVSEKALLLLLLRTCIISSFLCKTSTFKQHKNGSVTFKYFIVLCLCGVSIFPNKLCIVNSVVA